MVSAGLISFFNSLTLILGAEVGSTVTVQLVALKITTISPIFIIAGILLWFFSKDKLKLIGEAIFYFGLLFFGLSLMSQGLGIFEENQALLGLFQGTKNLLFGISAGFIFTAIIQSSAATIGILVLLAQQGLMTIDSALPIVLGASIGTAVTAILASLGAGKNAKRAALSHFFFKFFGVLIILPFLPFFISFLKFSTSNIAQQIATGHFLSSLAIVIIFVFLLKPFASLMKKIIPGEEKTLPLWPEWLNDKYLFDSNVALEAVRKELKREMKLTKREFSHAMEIIFEFRKSIVRDIFYIDSVVDNLQSEIMRYLDKISRLQPTKKGAEKLLTYSSMVDDIERIGDHATNLAKLAEYKKVNRAYFSKAAKKEIRKIHELVAKNLEDAASLIDKKDKAKIKAVFEREEKVDEAVKQARDSHLVRFYEGACLAMAGPIFNDMLVNFERISDHCVNIAEDVEQLD